MEFSDNDIHQAVILAQRRLLDQSDMVHYHIGEETTNLLGKISNLRGLLSIAVAIAEDDSLSAQETRSDTKDALRTTRAWTIEEDEHLTMWLADKVATDRICTALCRTPADVRHRIKSLSKDVAFRSKAREMLLFDDML